MSESVQKIERENSKNQQRADMQSVMSEAWGRRFVWSVIEGRGGMLRDPMSSSSRTTEYLLGRRSVSVELFDELGKECPDDRSKMVNENLEGLKK